MTHLWLGVVAVAALWLTVFLVLPVVDAWRRWRGTRIVTCPETQEAAAVDMDLRHAIVGSIAGRPEQRVRDCSRWPEHIACGQVCLAQVEESPEYCLVRVMLEGWYQGSACACCHRSFGPIHWHDHKPGLRSPDGRLREWSEIPPETVPGVLLTHKPVCPDCMVAEGFPLRVPEPVVERPARRGRGPAAPSV